MRVRAPAKINLHLRVGPRRADGFHPLLSWMVTVGLFDTLEFASDSKLVGSPLGGGVDDTSADPPLTLACDDPAIPTDSAVNLVTRAATALADTLPSVSREGPRTGKRVSAFLHKRIPAGAGLGGGSSDAASTLVSLNELWDARLSAARLAEVGATIGSDVPFFLLGPSSVCAGRGEIVRPIQRPRPRWALLVMPGVGISTAAVYRTFDDLGLGDEHAIRDEPDWGAWATMNAAALLPRLVNDLEPAAFAVEPLVGRLRSSLEAKLGRPVRMSGSGSTLFTLFDDRTEADNAARQLATLDGTRVEVVELAPPHEAPAV